MKRKHNRISLPLIALFAVLLAVLFAFILTRGFAYLSRKDGFESSEAEIVISRTNESLDWIIDVPFDDLDITVYNKGPHADFKKPPNLRKIIPLKNVGGESHTYLYHIVTNYDKLRDITIFLPGSCDRESKKQKAVKITETVKQTGFASFLSESKIGNIKTEFQNFTLDEYQNPPLANQSENPERVFEKSEVRPFGKWFEANFGDITVDRFVRGGIFSIAKADILHHPREYYEKLLAQLSTSSNPEAGHYIERSWAAVFHPMSNTKTITM